MSSAEVDAHLLPEAQRLLRDDDNLLRQIFFNILQKRHPRLATKVDVIYGMAREWCEDGTDDHFETLATYMAKLQTSERVLVASVFSHVLNLHNLSEAVSNAQAEKAARLGADPDHILRATSHSFETILNTDGAKADEIYKSLCTQSVDLVFTAHPTQALRRELLLKYAKMQDELSKLHNTKMSQFEKYQCLENLKGLVQSAWRTDEIHRRKPTPQDEMRAGLAYVQNVIFPALPIFLRRLDAALEKIGQPRLPVSHAPFRFGSWMGGDRDGNPNVTHNTTRDVCIIAKLAACDLYFKEIEQLMFDLSIWRANSELQKVARTMAANVDIAKVTEERKNKNYADFWSPFDPLLEPFRAVLSDLRDRLYRTREVLHQCLSHKEQNVQQMLQDEDCISSSEQLIEPLMLMFNSLNETGDEPIANGRLLDVIRQVHTFGLSLTRLDIRQEASRHAEVINAITEYLGMGSYSQWDEEKKLDFLITELQGKRPLMPPGTPMSPDAEEVVATLRTLGTLPPESLGAYIISMAKQPSDVLAVVLLQRECGIQSYLRVVPLFETLQDLDNAPNAMRKLLTTDMYRELIQGHQECMIGYSDSGKDAGRMAAAWALYQTQQKLVAVAEEFDVHLVLFHGRGGTVGRGGGPTHLSIKNQPPGTIKGNLRVTIQGEIINQQFGEKEVCYRTMDVYTSAVLEATLLPAQEPPQEWQDTIQKMSEVSCAVYRELVFKDPSFIKYFRTSTPVQELGSLNIGSRPSSRKKQGGIETLRAIPWIFAWTQTRLLLPVWLGTGEAIQTLKDEGQMDTLKAMYQKWTFFKVTLDMLEMVAEKADPRVTKMYDSKLVDEEFLPMGDDLRARFEKTKKLLSEVTGHGTLGMAAEAANPVLYNKIRLRAPYVTPLNILQASCLKDIRRLEESQAADGPRDLAKQPKGRDGFEEVMNDGCQIQGIRDALIITIKGIAAGMQNTG